MSRSLADALQATASGFQIAFANCAAFIATFTYLQEDAPDYKLGHSINLGALVLCIITVAAGIFYCKWENAKRERGDRDHRLVDEDESRLGQYVDPGLSNHPCLMQPADLSLVVTQSSAIPSEPSTYAVD
jgi:hypothetical protein